MKGILTALYFALICLATIGGAGYAITSDAPVIAFACIVLCVLNIADFFGWLKTPRFPK